MPATAYDRTPSNAGDTTFPTISTTGLPAASRRPLPNIVSAFFPSLPASFRSNSNTPASTPLNPETNHVKGPPAMKRPRGGHTRRPIETPQHGAPHTGRDLKSIEPNGEELAPVRRSSRLKSTTKPSTKVGVALDIADIRFENPRNRAELARDLLHLCRPHQPRPLTCLRLPHPIHLSPLPPMTGFAKFFDGAVVHTAV
jgi:hypothetical protein